MSREARPLRDLPANGTAFVLYFGSEALARLHRDVVLPQDAGEGEPTGALVRVVDGDYDEVWLSWSRRPHESGARYERWT